MTIRLRTNLPTEILKRFTRVELGQLAEALEIVPTSPNQQIVTFSQMPPTDTQHPWQQTDAEGRHIGATKRYTSLGTWV